MRSRIRKPRTQLGRVIREVIEADSVRVPRTTSGGKTKDGRYAIVASTRQGWTIGKVDHDPRLGIAKAISEALDPSNRRQECRTFADMTPEERAEMQRLYGKK